MATPLSHTIGDNPNNNDDDDDDDRSVVSGTEGSRVSSAASVVTARASVLAFVVVLVPTSDPRPTWSCIDDGTTGGLVFLRVRCFDDKHDIVSGSAGLCLGRLWWAKAAAAAIQTAPGPRIVFSLLDFSDAVSLKSGLGVELELVS
jgi:hypothetical protein